MRIRFWDTHIHLDKYGEQAANLVRESIADGLEALVAVSMDLPSCQRTAALAAEFSGVVLPAYGFHPEQPLPEEALIDQLFAWIEEMYSRVGEELIIGEVGLPYYSRLEAFKAGEVFDEVPYVKLLERFIAYAAKRDLPIVLHAVYEDAHQACDLLETYNIRRAHFHWFKGDDAAIRRIVQNGWFISFTPDIVYDPETKSLVGKVPLAHILTETDGPWSFAGPFAGRNTHPSMILEVLPFLAEAYGLTLESAAQILSRNAASMYGQRPR